jgi:hypothetical protein
MSTDDGYTGPMTGSFRGIPLVQCRRHPLPIWHHLGEECPMCKLEAKVQELEAARDQRCAECRKKGG